MFDSMTKEERFNNRNEKIRALFLKISEKNKKWRTDAVIKDVADVWYLSERTVEAIVKGEGIYNY